MKKISEFIFSAITAAILIPATSMAQDTINQGYLVDSSSNIVMSGTGLCWHDSDWTPARAVAQCDPTITLAAAAPALVSAPEAAPVVATAPAAIPPPTLAKPLPQKMSFSADALFAFDKSVLKPEGRAMLDDLVRQLKGTTYEVVIATGHTDRFGSAKYNQKLSVRRAIAVKDYLVSQDIPASRIDAKGKGETQPITKIGECKGAISVKVIACLQPDRRVDVEVQGTKQ